MFRHNKKFEKMGHQMAKPQISSIKISILIPVFNEEKIIKLTIVNLIKVFKKEKILHEIIAINDGSTDKSEMILKKLARKNKKIKVVSHEKNLGYGTALKTGINEAKYNWILISDADGTYPVTEIPKLLKFIPDYDMVIGARIKKRAKIPLVRKPAKKIVQLLATLLTGTKIPDINSGLRIFKKSLAKEFWHLLPEKFSFTSTLTLSSHLKKYSIKYVPISYYKREGKSSIKAFDFFYFLTLIIRLVVYFNPLKFFFWPGIVFITSGSFWIIFTIIRYRNITDTGILLLLSGIQIAFFGLIADLIVRNRERSKK